MTENYDGFLRVGALDKHHPPYVVHTCCYGYNTSFSRCLRNQWCEKKPGLSIEYLDLLQIMFHMEFRKLPVSAARGYSDYFAKDEIDLTLPDYWATKERALDSYIVPVFVDQAYCFFYCVQEKPTAVTFHWTSVFQPSVILLTMTLALVVLVLNMISFWNQGASILQTIRYLRICQKAPGVVQYETHRIRPWSSWKPRLADQVSRATYLVSAFLLIAAYNSRMMENFVQKLDKPFSTPYQLGELIQRHEYRLLVDTAYQAIEIGYLYENSRSFKPLIQALHRNKPIPVLDDYEEEEKLSIYHNGTMMITSNAAEFYEEHTYEKGHRCGCETFDTEYNVVIGIGVSKRHKRLAEDLTRETVWITDHGFMHYLERKYFGTREHLVYIKETPVDFGSLGEVWKLLAYGYGFAFMAFAWEWFTFDLVQMGRGKALAMARRLKDSIPDLIPHRLLFYYSHVPDRKPSRRLLMATD